MAQYKNVLRWLESRYLQPAFNISKEERERKDIAEDDIVALIKIEKLLEEALDYVREHQG